MDNLYFVLTPLSDIQVLEGFLKPKGCKAQKPTCLSLKRILGRAFP